MSNKTLIVNDIDISDCPAMNTFNIFGVNDKPCCYKYQVYCDAKPNCKYKQLKRELEELKKVVDNGQ